MSDEVVINGCVVVRGSPPRKAEMEFLRRHVTGMSLKESARKSGKSWRTEQIHAMRLKFRLGAKTLSQMVYIAMQTGLIK